MSAFPRSPATTAGPVDDGAERTRAGAVAAAALGLARAGGAPLDPGLRLWSLAGIDPLAVSDVPRPGRGGGSVAEV
ncbi:MAG TPA: hypothetical protein VFI47_25940, partial [Acidimicrobiales bacterium]|nr:hypothetical protein [Acidimicrobiales bacterium]